MKLEFTRYEKKDHIAYVTISRPDSLNSLHMPAHKELKEIWDDFEQDSGSSVAIVSGEGDKAFCAGSDLRYLVEANARGEEIDLVPPFGFGGLTNPESRPSKPIIAAVNGYALGGGFEMALACDLIIAAENARLGCPEPKVGLMAIAGGMHRLPRQLPPKIAMGLLLTGRQITAKEAHQYGLINEVVPLAELIPAAERWAKEIMECAPLAVLGSLQAAMTGLDIPLGVAMNQGYPLVEAQMKSEDWIEGPKAFVERRPPVWKGR